MYKQIKTPTTSIRINNSVEGETIETKIMRITQNREPIKDGAPIIFQERKEGVNPAYDIRTDRFEVAIDAMDKVAKAYAAKRENKADMKIIKNDQKDGGAESIQGQAAEPTA